MFAVVEIAGKQYKVTANEIIEVEKLDQKAGSSITFDKVLLLAEENGSTTQIGQPYVKGASVEAKIVEDFKGEKIIIHKFTAKKRYARTKGHRQTYTRLEIIGIKA